MFNEEKIKYLLSYFENVLENDFCDVLYDSETDPEFSAVTAANHLICYIDLLKALGKELKFDSIKTFFGYCNYTDDDFERFMKLYLKESKYYIGEIYSIE